MHANLALVSLAGPIFDLQAPRMKKHLVLCFQQIII
jgi:hypothetical protein